MLRENQMKLKRETEVAIALLIACARSSDCRVKTASAATAANTTTDFAARVALKLANAGFLKATRGPSGGLELSRPARSMLLGDIICRLGNPTSNDACCANGSLGQIIADASQAQRTFLDRFSIAGLADRQVSHSPNRMDTKRVLRIKPRWQDSNNLWPHGLHMCAMA